MHRAVGYKLNIILNLILFPSNFNKKHADINTKLSNLRSTQLQENP